MLFPAPAPQPTAPLREIFVDIPPSKHPSIASELDACTAALTPEESNENAETDTLLGDDLLQTLLEKLRTEKDTAAGEAGFDAWLQGIQTDIQGLLARTQIDKTQAKLRAQLQALDALLQQKNTVPQDGAIKASLKIIDNVWHIILRSPEHLRTGCGTVFGWIIGFIKALASAGQRLYGVDDTLTNNIHILNFKKYLSTEAIWVINALTSLADGIMNFITRGQSSAHMFENISCKRKNDEKKLDWKATVIKVLSILSAFFASLSTVRGMITILNLIPGLNGINWLVFLLSAVIGVINFITRLSNASKKAVDNFNLWRNNQLEKIGLWKAIIILLSSASVIPLNHYGTMQSIISFMKTFGVYHNSDPSTHSSPDDWWINIITWASVIITLPPQIFSQIFCLLKRRESEETSDTQIKMNFLDILKSIARNIKDNANTYGSSILLFLAGFTALIDLAGNALLSLNAGVGVFYPLIPNELTIIGLSAFFSAIGTLIYFHFNIKDFWHFTQEVLVNHKLNALFRRHAKALRGVSWESVKASLTRLFEMTNADTHDGTHTKNNSAVAPDIATENIPTMPFSNEPTPTSPGAWARVQGFFAKKRPVDSNLFVAPGANFV